MEILSICTFSGRLHMMWIVSIPLVTLAIVFTSGSKIYATNKVRRSAEEPGYGVHHDFGHMTLFDDSVGKMSDTLKEDDDESSPPPEQKERRPFGHGWSGYHVKKRPFVLFGGPKFGKRDCEFCDENFPERNENRFMEKRPFTLGGARFNFGKRNYEYDPYFDEDPYYLIENDMGPNEIEKRPFVLGGGTFGQRLNSGYKRNPWFGKIPRPYIYNFGKRSSLYYDEMEDEPLEKRPFVMNFGHGLGKRTPPYPFLSRDNDDDDSDLQKRPFVLGSGYSFGKRGKWPLNKFDRMISH